MDHQSAILTLSDLDREKIRSSLAPIDYDAAGGANYITELRRQMYTSFPDSLLKAIERLKGASLSYFVIDNLPIDHSVYGSPWFSETGRSFKSGVLSENVLVAVGAALGEPYSIAHEGAELVNNLTPHREAANAYTGLGSEVELDFHTENAAQTHRPQGDTAPQALMLLGLRRDPNNAGPKTRVADAREAISLLSDADIEQLRGKHFIIRVPHRWRGKEGPNRETLLSPIISGPLNKPRITVAFYPDMVIAADPESKAAFENLHRAVRAVSLGIDVRPGRLVYINNKFALHSRDKFTATFDENGRAYRWIQRLAVADSLWNFRTFRQLNERVFDPSGDASTVSLPMARYRSFANECAVSDESELAEMS